MWSKTFDHRLKEWYTLRQDVLDSDVETTLTTINSWWHRTPWTPYYLHWDEVEKWPDPWQLLDDNVFCTISRGYGSLCTIALLNRWEIYRADLIQTTDGNNLVVINDGDYILNWDKDSVLNTNISLNVERCLTQEQIKQKYL
jgi:hypothetical protein